MGNGERTVVMTRAFKGLTTDHYTFEPSASSSINFISAVGNTAKLAYHKLKSSSTFELTAVGIPSCICKSPKAFGHTVGSIVYTHDDGTTESIKFNGGDSHDR